MKKVLYLAIMAASKKWTMPIQNWKAAMNRFSIMFEERVTKYLKLYLHRIIYNLENFNWYRNPFFIGPSFDP